MPLLKSLVARTICYCMFASIALVPHFSYAQDPHAAEVEQMRIWYNPALKTDKTPLAHLNLRSVNYPGIISYNSKAATVELLFVGADKTEYDNIPFVSSSVGIEAESSSDNFLSASTLMSALSYALPLDYDNTYIALGFQFNYSFNRVGIQGATYHFPEAFDHNGSLGWAFHIDPYLSGLNKGYFTMGTGFSVFHEGQRVQWYVGGSMLDFNHPYTEWSYTSRLQSLYGLQGGCEMPLAENTRLNIYTNVSWQNSIEGAINQQFFSINASRAIFYKDTSSITASLGLGLRSDHILVPSAGMQFKKHHITGYYDLNAPGDNKKLYYRRSFALSYKFDF